MSALTNWHQVAETIADGLHHQPGSTQHDVALARLNRMAGICQYHFDLEDDGESERVSALVPDRIEEHRSHEGVAVLVNS